MRISGIRMFQVDLPLHEGSYKWSGGNSVSVFDATVVAVDTDEGISGWGEVCPLGPAYLPAYARGARAGIAELAPQLLGADPLALGTLNERMDSAMTIEDTWGGDIVTAAIAHLAHSTPERFRFSATDFNSYVTVAFADGAPQRTHGRLAASREPGLGVRPIMDVLGGPLQSVPSRRSP